MKVFIAKRLPLGKDFYAINICGFVFSRGKLSPVLANHEYIHSLQQREMLFVFFYLWYVVEWLVGLIRYRNHMESYRHISFEQEAYNHQHDLDYRHKRKPYAWLNVN